VITPEDPNARDRRSNCRPCEPDFLFSFYYRLMLKAPLLAIPGRGAYNMHGSLLPKYRGRVPVNWAIIHGERETGATLHRMLEKPDAGGIVAQQAVPILPDDTARTCSTRSRWPPNWRSTAYCPTCWPAPRPGRSTCRRKLLRRAQGRGRPHRLGPARRRGAQPDPRRGPALSGSLLRTPPKAAACHA
jgi:hypothetical protein